MRVRGRRSILEESDLSNTLRTILRGSLPAILLAASATTLQAQNPPVAAQQQREHVVRRGDTLWDLARSYLTNAFLWPMIYNANRAIVENPHRIFPGERLVIPPVAPAQPDAPLGQPVTDAPRPPAPIESFPVAPPQQQPRDTATVIASIDLRRPIVSMAEFLAAPWVSNTARNEVVGRIIRLVDPSAGADRLPSTLHPNDRVHLGALTASRQPGDTLVVVRFGRSIADRGSIIEPLALLRVDSVTPTVVTARVVLQFGEAKIGDVVLPLGQLPRIGQGSGSPVAAGPRGELMQFLIQEPLHGTTDIGFISLGSDVGVGIGDEFVVYVPPRELDAERAEVLPPTEVGVVRVIKVGQNSATVRVLRVSNAGLTEGLPVRLIRKMMQ
jgi:hypothetical protein